MVVKVSEQLNDSFPRFNFGHNSTPSFWRQIKHIITSYLPFNGGAII